MRGGVSNAVRYFLRFIIDLDSLATHFEELARGARRGGGYGVQK